jgi:KaiC/GvpD/RAD55 family RecA-like ATPase
LLSGSIYGGLPDSRITAIAGEAATGKTFFALGIVKSFLDKIKKLVLFTLKVKVQYQNLWLKVVV